MAFLTISDSSGEMEAIAFPVIYKRYLTLLGQGKFAVLAGKIEEREEKLQLIIQQVDEMQQWIDTKPRKQPVLYLKIINEKEDEKTLKEINQLLSGHKGGAAVILHYETSRRTLRLGPEKHVNPNAELLRKLKGILGPQNVVLKD